MLIDAARKGLTAPVNLTWEITLKCNLRCRHCLSSAGQPHPGELSTQECYEVIDQLAENKVFQINVGGGEPFARRDFFLILQYAKQKGIVACISTNGTMIDPDVCRRLADLGRVYLQVSLDGVDEQTNDGIRGENTYKRALSGMSLLAGHGLHFSVNTVLTRQNYDQLEPLKALAAAYGATLRVSRFRPSGRARGIWQELAPRKEQLESFSAWLQKESDVLTGDSFFSLTSEKRRRMGLDLCGAAKMTCCLSPSGEVYPCAFLQEDRFSAGNLRKQRLFDIWHNSSVMRTFRSLDVNSCHSCFRFDSCRGGCPAVAYFMHNDLSRPDPECMIQCLGPKAREVRRADVG